MYVLTLETAI